MVDDPARWLCFNCKTTTCTILGEEKIGVAPQSLEKVKKSNEFLTSVNSRYNIYGVNTGLGPMAQFSVSDDKLVDLQYNLIRSHNTGYPSYLGLPECKSVFVSRLNTLVRGIRR